MSDDAGVRSGETGGRSGSLTDRRVGMEDIDRLRFDDDGLLPVVAQDAGRGDVLMVAWANREAVEATLREGVVHFWSRSRGSLWRKGETSGNTLTLVSLHADCDGDTLLARVRPAGPSCHTGEATCFGAGAAPDAVPHRAAEEGTVPADAAPPSTRAEASGAEDVLDRLDRTLRERARERPEGSYTVRLLVDENLRLKKLGEETAEVLTALARGDGAGAVEEAADLVYHLLVALRAEDVGLDEVRAALADRAG